MSVFQSIWLGVFSGILASMGFMFLGKIYWSIIDPYLKTLRYNGISIDGEWFAAPNRMSQNFAIELTQKATQLKGIATLVVRDDNKQGYYEDMRSFELEGEIRDRFVHLNGKCIDKSRIGTINFLLEVTGDGRQLVGYSCFYSVNKMSIVEQAIVLTRDKHSPMETEAFMIRRGNAIYEARLKGFVEEAEEDSEFSSNDQESSQTSLFDELPNGDSTVTTDNGDHVTHQSNI